ncbi:DinB family protein [Rhodococcus sp. NPDC058521]|uniref:DinB family protein n=1 Tax=Rhodococcus sp. NPDC058521 TaxID=3346536 RepID=UPI00365E42A9
MSNSTSAVTGERADILAILEDQRHNFLITLRGLDQEKALARTTVSELTLGGLVKHLTEVEGDWITTVLEPDENAVFDMDTAVDTFHLVDGELFSEQVKKYEAMAARTREAIASLDDLDVLVPLPIAPWSPEREWWTARKILLHIIRETSQHSGHADIIRESLDGANTTMQMGADAGMEF